MTAFTVWKFEDPTGAQHAAEKLRDCERENLIKILDYAVVTWPVGAARPETDRHNEEKWRGTGWGALWGVIVGALFFVPVIGGVAGAAIGAIAKMTADAGITKEQLERIRTQVTPGTSALFVLTTDAVLDKVEEAFSGQRAELLFTNLSKDQEDALREAFAD